MSPLAGLALQSLFSPSNLDGTAQTLIDDCLDDNSFFREPLGGTLLMVQENSPTHTRVMGV